MKAFKVIAVLVFALNITAAFAEQVQSDCSQINDSTDRSAQDRPVSSEADAPASGAVQG